MPDKPNPPIQPGGDPSPFPPPPPPPQPAVVAPLPTNLEAALTEIKNLRTLKRESDDLIASQREYIKGVEMTSENREQALNSWEKQSQDRLDMMTRAANLFLQLLQEVHCQADVSQWLKEYKKIANWKEGPFAVTQGPQKGDL